MKKFFSILLVIAVFLCAAPSVSAAGSAGWTGPSVVRAGDTITLTFYAGGGIYGGNGTVSYDPSILTLQGYTPCLSADWALEWGGNNFLFYHNSLSELISDNRAIFTATFSVNASAAVGATISVSATGVTLSNKQQDIGIGTATYSTTVAEPLSDNNNLASLSLGGATIAPAFSPAVTYYSATVPYSVSTVTIAATAEDDGATVTVYNPALVPNATTTLSVTVTAENGAKKIYSIGVFRMQDPNYVPSSNANLKSLTAEGYVLSPAFQPDVTQYYIWLPYEAEQIRLSAGTEETTASYTVGQCDQLTAGERTDIPVTVTAEDGSQKVYTVTAVRAPAHDQVEAYLSGEPAETEPTVPDETEPTTPDETEPTTPAETEPTVPAAPAPVQSSGRKLLKYLLVAGVGFLAGAGILSLIVLLSKKRR